MRMRKCKSMRLHSWNALFVHGKCPLEKKKYFGYRQGNQTEKIVECAIAYNEHL